MTVKLEKGQRVSLDKLATGLTKITAGLGWNPATQAGVEFDLDATAFLLKGDKIRTEADFIFYNQLSSTCGSVKLSGDNRTGQGDGDDEQIFIDLTKIPADVDKIAIAASIHKAQERGQNFGQVSDAYIRIVNDTDNKEVARFDLTEDSSTNTAVVFAELYRKDNEWKLNALGKPTDGGLLVVAKGYGVNVE